MSDMLPLALAFVIVTFVGLLRFIVKYPDWWRAHYPLGGGIWMGLWGYVWLLAMPGMGYTERVIKALVIGWTIAGALWLTKCSRP